MATLKRVRWISQIKIAAGVPWHRCPTTLRDLMVRLLQVPTLTKATISLVRNLPLSLFRVLPSSLSCLSVNDCTLLPPLWHVDEALAPLGAPVRLHYLETSFIVNDLARFGALGGPVFDFSCLREICLYPCAADTDVHISHLLRSMPACQILTLDYSTALEGFRTRIDLIDLGDCVSLRDLAISGVALSVLEQDLFPHLRSLLASIVSSAFPSSTAAALERVSIHIEVDVASNDMLEHHWRVGWESLDLLLVHPRLAGIENIEVHLEVWEPGGALDKLVKLTETSLARFSTHGVLQVDASFCGTEASETDETHKDKT
ncbi:hypothetical protein FISHEDRAFT_60370 [Fistulina hepatica ATCC 64428]|uniref:Uncharacterized protein n=1 Tax=Fistulina hepatica ATCC 64428 TaxID=1128425 RepID=A0A0D7A6G5_9AGAR|nr:hypothetical protein FISHEDRAFT_60370 [Fistulina hepatica ATCC 64428]